MRSLRLLAAGLAVIALWGICLQLMITRWRVDNEPQRLANDMNAQPLTDRSATDESKIQLAAFNHPAPLPAEDPVTIDSVVDPAANVLLQWNKEHLQDVWLSSLRVDVNIADVVDPATTTGQGCTVNVSGSGKALSVTLADTVPPVAYLSVIKVTAAATPSTQVRLSTAPSVGSVKLRVHRPTDLPRPPRALSLQLGTHYPVIYDSFPTSTTKIFPGQKSRIRFGVDATQQASQLTVIEYEQSTTNKIVRSVSPPVSVSGDAPVAIEREIDARVLKPGSTAIGCYFVGHSPDGTIAFSDQPVSLTVGNSTGNLPSNANFTLNKITHGKVDAIRTEGTTLPEFATTNQLTRPEASIVHNYAPTADAPRFAWRLYANGRPCSPPAELATNTSPVQILGLELDEGTNILEARFFQGEQPLKEIALGTVNVKTGGFRITEIGPPEFGRTVGVSSFYIDFTNPVNLSANTATRLTEVKAAVLVSKSPRGVFAPNGNVTSVDISSSNVAETRLTITPAAETTATAYLIKVLGGKLMDVYGNLLEGSDGRVGAVYEQRLGSTGVDSPDLYPVTPGVTRGQAPVVTYPQFVEPNQQPKGFNPNDRVETRVARLYFYRDAHRVAQILNRRAQSYNRQDVAMRRQFADKARQEADSLTTARQIAERRAVETAQKTRELQNQASDLQRSMDFSLRQMQQLALSGPPPNMSPQDFQALQRQQLGQLENATRDLSNQIRDVESQLRNARDTEVVSNEQMQQAQRGEELAKAEQFRLETAAAHADPDTFAAGDPNSIDPVAQVSISVIGEGLLHLRGPLRGVNQVRIMIDQMDAPCGQVRLNIHSTQINGDEADKMEVVANRIQTYIDQARFLTVQSGEMLRKSVVQCAAMRAEESRGLYPGETQADRDQRYLYSFFGRDFAEELRAMDSEMLRTGNKLLSLHSMDVTSLSSALMLMALANNSSRLAILQQFEALVKTELAQAEQQYMHNGIGCCTNGCKPGCKHHKEAPPICYLSGNASFTSLRGFFDTQLSHDDTMSPLQREMIRLAQILKARLVTEMEYKQRVMERALIEERLESVTDTNAQLGRERATQQELVMARESLYKARAVVIPNITQSMSIVSVLAATVGNTDEAMTDLSEVLVKVISGGKNTRDQSAAPTLNDADVFLRKFAHDRAKAFEYVKNHLSEGTEIFKKENAASVFKLYVDETRINQNALTEDQRIIVYLTENDRNVFMQRLCRVKETLLEAKQTLEIIHPEKDTIQNEIKSAIDVIDSVPQLQTRLKKDNFVPLASVDQAQKLVNVLGPLVRRARNFMARVDDIAEQRDAFLVAFARFEENNTGRLTRVERAADVFRLWSLYAAKAIAIYGSTLENNQSQITRRLLSDAAAQLNEWVKAVGRLDAAYSLSQDARRPLDHKKFLDMLIDDLEEKYIELLEGTRAHTANIDNYLKRLTTALDDDFNTQFYYPVFRMVREASQFKTVEFGQTETTNVLANNRELGKVSPAATMEFDLPKRDILINEGINAALATYNDLGALVNDPNLMALAKLNSGQTPASPPAGSLGGYGAVRSVYPGLSTDVSGRLVNQNAGSGPEFESNVEKLIPDPAIYKFETGTGYEIRPVIAPDGQAVVFDFNYMYTTQIREPVRADEKHLGRVKQHFIDTDVQLSNFELREVSRYVVALKAARTAKGVPLLEDIPVVGALWRPLPSDEKSLQQNIIMAQATIFPTLFDLMGLRWAQAVSDLDPLRLSNREYLVRSRHQFLENRVYDISSSSVDDFLRIPDDIRRADLYRSQETIPSVHPNGYRGPGMDIEVSAMREGFNPESGYTPPGYIPASSAEGASYLPHRPGTNYEQLPTGDTPMPSPTRVAPGLQLPTPPPSQGSNSWETKRIK